MRSKTTLGLGAALILTTTLGGCVVGPNYQRPSAPVSTTFKEAAGWKPSQPADAIDRGAWWSIYNDPLLDQLERKVAVSNQNVAAMTAAYQQAHALVAYARSQYYPTIAGDLGATRSKRAGAPPAGGTATAYDVSVGASWAPDLWGRVRRTVEENTANAQAAAADIASAQLSAQTELAVDYFSLRISDANKALLNATVQDYQRFLDITNNKYNAGVAARSDVVTAQSQLLNAQAAAVNLGVLRAQYEHAIAMLTGVPPAELTIVPVATTPSSVPTVPVDVASTLLERRPDIAAAERTMAAANAAIGIAVAAYYPNITLTGSYGFTSNSLSNLFSASSSAWSVGPALAETLFDFGARKAQVASARAAYDQKVALYRQTVLSAFQGVEDEIAAAKVLEQEAVVRVAADQAAIRAEQLALNQYQAGQVDYTTVVTAQNTALSSQETSLNVLQQRLNASVTLIENLGGGWDTTQLPAS